MDIYGDNQNIIPELLSYMDEVLPKKKDEVSMKAEVLDVVMEIEQYLQHLNEKLNSSYGILQ